MKRLNYMGHLEVWTCGLPLNKIIDGVPCMMMDHRDFKFLCDTTNQIVANCKKLISYKHYAKGKEITCKYVNKKTREFYVDGEWYGELKINKLDEWED